MGKKPVWTTSSFMENIKTCLKYLLHQNFEFLAAFAIDMAGFAGGRGIGLQLDGDGVPTMSKPPGDSDAQRFVRKTCSLSRAICSNTSRQNNASCWRGSGWATMSWTWAFNAQRSSWRSRMSSMNTRIKVVNGDVGYLLTHYSRTERIATTDSPTLPQPLSILATNL